MIAKTRALVVPKKIARTADLPASAYLDPPFVYLAITNARCSEGETYVKIGDHVDRGQVIGLRRASFFIQPIHASISGTVTGIEKHYHRSGKLVEFIKIANDKKDTWVLPERVRSDEEIFKLTREEMTEILKEKALVGLGGSSFPTYVKFMTKEPIDLIMINGIECEPLISSDYRMLIERPEEIMDGIRFVLMAFKAKKAMLCFKKKHKALVSLYQETLRRHPDIPIELKLSKNYYPAGWEMSMIKDHAHISIKPGALPSSCGIMNFNVSTLLGILLALRYDRPVLERYVTISGDGIKYPRNLLIRVGTSLKDVLALCGGYVDDRPKVIILGGPMMGASLASDDVILTKTVTSVIVLQKKEYREDPCIRCGSCALSCPAHLMPMQIMNALKAMNKERLKALHPERCVECGLCAYSCSSRINVTDYVRRAKLLVR